MDNNTGGSNPVNPYTLDPTSVTPPSAPPAQPTSNPYPLYPNLNPNPNPNPQPNPYPHPIPHPYPQGYPTATNAPTVYPAQIRVDIGKIQDWLPWSIVNIFLGGLIPGIIPLIFTLVCRDKKKKNDLKGARTMSKLALASNIIVTFVAIAAVIAVIIYFTLWPRYFGSYVSI